MRGRFRHLPGSGLVLVSGGRGVPGLGAGGMIAFDPETSDLVVVFEVAEASDVAEAEVRVASVLADMASRRGHVAPQLEAALEAAANPGEVIVDRWSVPLGGCRGEVWWPGGHLAVPRPAFAVGPQSDSDSQFVAKMRLAQSRWRAEVLAVPAGYGPQAAGRELGSMLTHTDALLGRNFLTRAAWKAAEQRIAEGPGVEPVRCRANLLSSQPMAFNLFGPLVDEPDVAGRLLGSLLPGGLTEVLRVRVEYAPEPAAEYLDDRTSFDVFVEYLDGDGQKAFVGIETKLSEPFSTVRYETDRYRDLTEALDSPWLVGGADLADPKWNQLWRNHLLVEATRTHPASPHGRRGFLAVVHHPDDPSIGEAIGGYRQFLRYPEGLQVWPLDQLLATMRSATDDERLLGWLDRFTARYL